MISAVVSVYSSVSAEVCMRTLRGVCSATATVYTVYSIAAIAGVVWQQHVIIYHQGYAGS